jgi:hypothetical protein
MWAGSLCVEIVIPQCLGYIRKSFLCALGKLEPELPSVEALSLRELIRSSL